MGCFVVMGKTHNPRGLVHVLFIIREMREEYIFNTISVCLNSEFRTKDMLEHEYYEARNTDAKFLIKLLLFC